MREIILTVGNNQITANTHFAGYSGEHLATVLKYKLPNTLQGDEYTYVLCFENDKGTFYANIDASPVEYLLPQGLMVQGTLHCQLTILKDSGQTVYKSPDYQLEIFQSIESTDQVDEKYAGLIDDSIAKFNAACKLLEQVGAKVERVTGGALVTVTDQKGTTTAMIYDGSGGGSGKSITNCEINADGHLIIIYFDGTEQDCGKVVGADGRGIVDIKLWAENGNFNIYQITYTDGTTSVFNVYNGRDGDKGDKGDTGAQGIQGVQGEKGADGVNGIDGKDGASGVPPVTNMTETTAQLEPNNMYIWGEITSLDITMAEPTDNTRLNEYMFQFACGDIATVLSLPSDIRWITEPNIEANHTYQVSIVNDIGVIGGV